MSPSSKLDPDPRSLEEARLLLGGLRALVRTQQVSERANVSCCGMTVAQAATLHVLYLEGPMRLGALSRRLGIAPSTLTRNVERIEARGWVERVEDPDDGRAFRMRLTTRGRAQGRQIEAQNEGAARQLLAQLPPQRRKRVVSGLMDLLEAMDGLLGPCCPDQFRPIHDFLEGVSHAEDRDERR
jgi:DNA-binding MarR family transcriptional regulator